MITRIINNFAVAEDRNGDEMLLWLKETKGVFTLHVCIAEVTSLGCRTPYRIRLPIRTACIYVILCNCRSCSVGRAASLHRNFPIHLGAIRTDFIWTIFSISPHFIAQWYQKTNSDIIEQWTAMNIASR